MSVIFYILSIAFQMAGALILIIYATSTKRGDVIRRFAQNSVIFEDGNTHELTYNHEYFMSMYETAYYSKVAFIYIVAGYGLGVMGESCKSITIIELFAVFIFAFLLIAGANWIVHRLLKKDNVLKEITKNELDALGIEAHVSSIGNDYIKNLFESDDLL